jgi:hypothetical protein
MISQGRGVIGDQRKVKMAVRFDVQGKKMGGIARIIF